MIKVTENYYLKAAMSGYQVYENKTINTYEPKPPKGGIPAGKEQDYKLIKTEKKLEGVGYYPHNIQSGLLAILQFELAKGNDIIELNTAINKLESMIKNIKDPNV